MDLDTVVAAHMRSRKAQAKLASELEGLEISIAYQEARAAECEWIAVLEEFVHQNGAAIHDPNMGPWLRLHLSRTLGWTADQIFELEDVTRYKGDGCEHANV